MYENSWKVEEMNWFCAWNEFMNHHSLHEEEGWRMKLLVFACFGNAKYDVSYSWMHIWIKNAGIRADAFVFYVKGFGGSFFGLVGNMADLFVRGRVVLLCGCFFRWYCLFWIFWAFAVFKMNWFFAWNARMVVIPQIRMELLFFFFLNKEDWGMKFFWFYLIIHALVCKRIFSAFFGFI